MAEVTTGRTIGQLINGMSKLTNGRVFNLTSAKTDHQTSVDGNKFPVWVTNIADTETIGGFAVVWPQSQLRPKIDILGNEVWADGTFDKLVQDLFKADDSVDADVFIQTVFEKVNGRKLKVRRKPYNGINSKGRKQQMSILCIDFE